MSPGGAQWSTVAIVDDLMAASRDLSQLAHDYRQEARGWADKRMRGILEDRAATLVTWSQEAAIESSRGDDYSRLEALYVARERITAARIGLRQIFQAGELWNSHRLRPVPASIGKDFPQ